MEDQLKQVFINGHYSIESLTKDVSVKPIHSHNDEWRQHPLFDALKIGSNSIEADVHYKSKNPNLIYVGHNSASLSDKKNLESMYLNPLYQLLEEANPISSDNDNNIIEKKNGIFYNSPENTTYFYLDIKNDRENLIKTLDNKLQRFSDKGFLTIFNTTSNEFIQGPLTIIITGDYPYEYINSMKIRTMFIDAPLKSISQDSNEASKYPSQKISIFASDPLNKLVGSHQTISLFNGLSKKQVNTISGIVDNAHSLGLKTRIWDTPKFTYSSKVKIWKQLLSIGSDYLNVDSLQQAVKF
ncbi:hypothetical protein CANARDRAFT_29823 [[Candida] arabinofermentans NRRL YB-2248]|uniref:Altered inheritance of mitochondria protein 6 n=1 Tax=[Candida] arabinofermentans NRRL YB-2248 TaxID=983967 RepID=A0A1E4SVS0_9ASCO|nr:hypothetical protein CANARDRAFT_29823 [[Candida] arabinofermentans NRRL YB-2248]